MPTTTAQELQIKRADAKVKAMSTAHSMDMAEQSHKLSVAQSMQPEAEDQSEPGEQPENTSADNSEDVQEGEAPDLTPEDEMLISELTKRGYNDAQVAQAISMMKQGLPNDQVIQALHSTGGENG